MSRAALKDFQSKGLLWLTNKFINKFGYELGLARNEHNEPKCLYVRYIAEPSFSKKQDEEGKEKLLSFESKESTSGVLEEFCEEIAEILE